METREDAVIRLLQESPFYSHVTPLVNNGRVRLYTARAKTHGSKAEFLFSFTTQTPRSSAAILREMQRALATSQGRPLLSVCDDKVIAGVSALFMVVDAAPMRPLASLPSATLVVNLNRYATSLLEALVALHEMGAVHTRLHLDYCFVDSKGRFRLALAGLYEHNEEEELKAQDALDCGKVLYNIFAGFPIAREAENGAEPASIFFPNYVTANQRTIVAALLAVDPATRPSPADVLKWNLLVGEPKADTITKSVKIAVLTTPDRKPLTDSDPCALSAANFGNVTSAVTMSPGVSQDASVSSGDKHTNSSSRSEDEPTPVLSCISSSPLSGNGSTGTVLTHTSSDNNQEQVHPTPHTQENPASVDHSSFWKSENPDRVILHRNERLSTTFSVASSDRGDEPQTPRTSDVISTGSWWGKQTKRLSSHHSGRLLPDDLVSVYRSMTDPIVGVNIRYRRRPFKPKQKCFVAREAVDWIMDNIEVERSRAAEIAQELLQAGAISCVSGKRSFFSVDDNLYSFNVCGRTSTRDSLREVRGSVVLNSRWHVTEIWKGIRPLDLTRQILTKLIEACKNHTSVRESHAPVQSVARASSRRRDTQEGLRRISRSRRSSRCSHEFQLPSLQECAGRAQLNLGVVDCHGLRESDAYRQFEEMVGKLQAVDLTLLESVSEKVAFSINLYNILSLHQRIHFGPPSSRTEEKRQHALVSYRVSSMLVTMDMIANEILRPKKRSSSRSRKNGLAPQLSEQHRRLLAITPGLPKALLALNKGSPEDAPIRVYSAKNLQRDLRDVISKHLERWVVVHNAGAYYDDVVRLPQTVREFSSEIANSPLPGELRLSLRAYPESGNSRGSLEAKRVLKWIASNLPDQSMAARVGNASGIDYWGRTLGPLHERHGKEPLFVPVFW